MATIPTIPASAPFSPEQRAWLNGYLAALFPAADSAPAPSPSAAAEPLLVMYGSQTGTAEAIARRIAREAAQRGFAARVLELNAFASIDLTKELRLAVVTSTWGDGEPPDNAIAFWQHLSSEAAPRLEQLTYSVLALGDRNYSDFCGAGKKFDERLAGLGAKRVLPRTDCDTDYEASAKTWMDGLWSAFSVSGPAGPTTNGIAPAPASAETTAKPMGYSRTNPFPARLVTNRKLNGPVSAKDTRHFEISLEGSGLSYEVGDALGVVPQNCPALVNEILAALGCDGEEAVTGPAGDETSLRNALVRSFQITKPGSSFLQTVAERAGDSELKALLDPARKADLDKFMYGREVIDILQRCPGAKFAAKEFVGLLAKLQPRLYSISSSPKAHPGQVHLTVAAVRYESYDRARKGVCSTFLADRVELNTTPVPVFVQTSHGFRLPPDLSTPVIMVGPGTGVAPFRAFLEERRATGAKGGNWLFFGDQHAAQDFLYRDELEAMKADGTLTRFDTAFSRDQAEKIYVQTRMLEQATDLWRWLEDGAHLYVCGDAKRMAKDVDAALHKVIESAGARTSDQAAEYVQKLKSAKRYQRDVY